MKWKLFAVAVVLIAALVVGCGGRQGSARSGSGLPSADAPQSVPSEGLVMNEFSGMKTPVPVAFYPNGKIYGMTAIKPKTGQAAMAIEGTYDDPQKVAAYYQQFYQDTTRAQRLQVDGSYGPTAGGFYWKAHAYGPSGFTIISISTSPKGLSRDIAKWTIRPDVGYDPVAGGDPKETMIWLAIKWK